MTTTLVVVALLLAAATFVSVEHRSSSVAAPVDFVVFVRLEPRAENRMVVVEADGDPGQYHRTDIDAPGERAWRVKQVRFRLESGCYVFRATAIGEADRVLASSTSSQLAVVGRDGYPCPLPQ